MVLLRLFPCISLGALICQGCAWKGTAGINTSHKCILLSWYSHIFFQVVLYV